jgi:hypothetical protein
MHHFLLFPLFNFSPYFQAIQKEFFNSISTNIQPEEKGMTAPKPSIKPSRRLYVTLTFVNILVFISNIVLAIIILILINWIKSNKRQQRELIMLVNKPIFFDFPIHMNKIKIQ